MSAEWEVDTSDAAQHVGAHKGNSSSSAAVKHDGQSDASRADDDQSEPSAPKSPLEISVDAAMDVAKRMQYAKKSPPVPRTNAAPAGDRSENRPYDPHASFGKTAGSTSRHGKTRDEDLEGLTEKIHIHRGVAMDASSTLGETTSIEDSRSNNFDDIADDKYEGLKGGNIHFLTGSNADEAARGISSDDMLGSSLAELAEYSSASSGLNPADLKLSSGASHQTGRVPSGIHETLHKQGSDADLAGDTPSASPSQRGGKASNENEDEKQDEQENQEGQVPAHRSGKAAPSKDVDGSEHGDEASDISTDVTARSPVRVSGFNGRPGGGTIASDRTSSGRLKDLKASSDKDSSAADKQGSEISSSSKHKKTVKVEADHDSQDDVDDTASSDNDEHQSSTPGSSSSGSHSSKKPSTKSETRQGREDNQAEEDAEGTDGDSRGPVATTKRSSRRLLSLSDLPSASDAASSGWPDVAAGSHHMAGAAAVIRPQERSLAQLGLMDSSIECRWAGSEQEEADPALLTPTSNHTACRYENLVLFNGQVIIQL